MSFQVGDSCYANLADAGVAACAAFMPSTVVTADGSKMKSTSCAGATEYGLYINVSTIDLVAGTSNLQTFTVAPSYAPCIENQKWDAYMSIFGVALGVFVTVACLWKIYVLINSNTRIAE